MSKSIVHKITENNRATWINVIKIAHWWVFLNLISSRPKYISAQNDVIWNDFMETNQFWFVWLLFFFCSQIGCFFILQFDTFWLKLLHSFLLHAFKCMYVHMSKKLWHKKLWRKKSTHKKEREIRRKKKKKCENYCATVHGVYLVS